MGRVFALLEVVRPGVWAGRGRDGERVEARPVLEARGVPFERWERVRRDLEAVAGCGVSGLVPIVEVLDAGSGERRCLWVIERAVAGCAADALPPGGPEEALDGMTAVLAALAPLHGRASPVVHGAISPAVVRRREDGTWLLGGFGASATVADARSDVLAVAELARFLLRGSAPRPEVAAILDELGAVHAMVRPVDARAALERLATVHPLARVALASLPGRPATGEGVQAAESQDTFDEAPGASRSLGGATLSTGLGLALAGFLLVGAVAGLQVARAGVDPTAGVPPAIATEQVGLAKRLSQAHGLRMCADRWRGMFPDAPEEAPTLAVTILASGTLAPVLSSGPHDLLRDLPGCVRDALPLVSGPAQPLRAGGRRLVRLEVSLGAPWAEQVTYTWRWEG